MFVGIQEWIETVYVREAILSIGGSNLDDEILKKYLTNIKKKSAILNQFKSRALFHLKLFMEDMFMTILVNYFIDSNFQSINI